MESWQRTYDWGVLTWAEIASARDAGALTVLTVGSCEQHADHLPVDTDTLSAYRVVMLAADRCDSPHVLVLPPPSFGFSPHHRAWPGTVSLSLATFIGLVTDVAESLHRTGFDRLLIVNGHGGNVGPLTSACTELVSRGLRVAAVTYFSPAYTDGGPNLLQDTGMIYAALFAAGDPGYYGDPAAATVEAGEKLLEQTVDGLAGFFTKFAAATLKVGAP